MIAALLLALIAPTPAPAVSAEATSQAAPAPAKKAKEEAKERKICKRFDISGSRLGGERVCRTAAQWRAMED